MSPVAHVFSVSWRRARGWLIWGGLCWDSLGLSVYVISHFPSGRPSLFSWQEQGVNRIKDTGFLRPKSGNGILSFPLNIVQSKSEGQCIFKEWGNVSFDERSYKVTLQRAWILRWVENCGCFCNQSIPTSNEDIKKFCWGS